MAIEPFTAASPNLSRAWAEVLLRLLDPGIEGLSPAVVIVSEFADGGVPAEIAAIRQLLDTELTTRRKPSVHTVSNTIFPESLWRPGEPDDAAELYARYARVWPRIGRDRRNHHGVYFQRLTSFRPGGCGDLAPVNQLQQMLECYRNSNHRRSALQAGLFDPTADHRNARYLGFPCLQQVAFTPIGGEELGVTGFYATQYQLEKAYGNYLGLCRLGRFVAAQLGRRLVRMSCVASLALGDGVPKSSAFAQSLRTIVSGYLEELRPA
jgi:hypothetical protein